MNVVRIDRLDDPRLDEYRNVRDADLIRRRGVFLAEGRFILRQVLAPGGRFRPRSALLTPAAMESLAEVLPALGTAPVYLVEQPLMNGIVGFDIHRGCLAAIERGDDLSMETLLAGIPEGPAVLLVLDELTNHDNVGGLFRSAAAFGAAGALLAPRCCDPLYRKCVRVSMGGVLRVPFARWPGPPELVDDPTQGAAVKAALHAAGFTMFALDPAEDAADIAEAGAALAGRAAIILGAEGAGLSPAARAMADARLRIPMSRGPEGVDSLNVAVAGSIVLHEACRARKR